MKRIMRLRLTSSFRVVNPLLALALFLLLLAPSPTWANAHLRADTLDNATSLITQVGVKDPCKSNKLKHLPKSNTCTHGPDPAPPGRNIAKSVPPLPASALSPAPAIQCDGDGVSGARVQVIYAHASDVADRYNTYLPSFRQWAADADQIYQDSAAETGGNRRIRFVHDSSCNVTVLNVTLSTVGDDTFDNTISELQNLGHNRGDRKYMLFVDANVYCGIGGIQADDQASTANRNNVGPSYGRNDAGCWEGWVAAHELMHNLGGVQLSAPNTSGGWHCVDEYEVMCYSDSPNFPPMQIICGDPTRDTTRLDCGHDDYYHTNPPAGSYLATHWNTVSSQFLIGSAPPPPCPDASYEPDDSANQARAFTIGATEQHAFCVSNDQDWVSFQGSSGTTYRIETLNLAAGNDTVLELYQSDGTSLIASDDDGNGGLASLITFSPGASARYLIKARHFSGSGGVGLTYDLRISASTPPNLLRNAGFELDTNGDNRPDNWTSNSRFTRSSASVYAGSFSGRHRATDNLGHTIQQTIGGLTAGRTYSFSGRVNIPATTDAFTFRIQIRWRNAGNTTIRTDTIKTYTGATAGWNLAAGGRVAPAGTANAQVRMVTGNLNATIYVDAFNLQS